MRLSRLKSRTDALTDPTLFRPPELQAADVKPFTEEDRATLGVWLAEGGWPRGAMDAPMLEGYIIGLLVWPVGVPAGAWLPPVWGGQGWKVPAKLGSLSTYTKFTGLVVAFMHELDRGLGATPPCFEPHFITGDVPWNGGTPASSWALGFMRALELNLQGLKWRSPAARAAVTRIAQFASVAVIPAIGRADIVEDLTCAVFTLADERTSRGPLGALETPAVAQVAPSV